MTKEQVIKEIIAKNTNLKVAKIQVKSKGKNPTKNP